MTNESIFPYAYVLNDKYQEAREAELEVECAKILKKMETNTSLGYVYVPILKPEIKQQLLDLGYDVATINGVGNNMHESKIDWRKASFKLMEILR